MSALELHRLGAGAAAERAWVDAIAARGTAELADDFLAAATSSTLRAEAMYLRGQAQDVSPAATRRSEEAFRTIREDPALAGQAAGSFGLDRALMAEAAAAMGVESYPAALAALGQLIRRFPGGDWTARAQWWSALCWYRLSQDRETLAECVRIIDKTPHHPYRLPALGLRGTCELRLGHPEAARSAFLQMEREAGVGDRILAWAAAGQAEAASAAGDGKAARSSWGRAAALEPRLASLAAERAGELWLADGDLNRALATWGGAGAAGLPAMAGGSALGAAGRWDEALLWFDRDSSPEGRYRAGWAAWRLRRWTEAAERFGLAEEGGGAWAEPAALARAAALAGGGAWDTASFRYRRFLDRYPGSAWRGLALAGAAAAEAEAGRAAEAASLYRQAASTLAASTDWARALEPDVDLAEGRTLAGLGRPAGAREAFERAKRVADAAGDQAAADEAALSLAEMGDELSPGSGRKALQKAAAAIRTPAVLERARFDLIRAALRGGAAREALEAAQAFVSHHPDSPRAGDARLSVAEALAALGRGAEALALLEEIRRTGPGSAAGLQAAYRIGEVYRLQGREQDAVAAFRRFLDAYPLSEQAQALYPEVGAFLLEQGDAVRAAEVLEAVVERFPRAPGASHSAFLAGRARFEARDYAAAATNYARVAAQYPDAPQADEAAFREGDAHLLRQDQRAALKAYARTVQRYPDSPWAPEALARMAEIHDRVGDRQAEAEDQKTLETKYPDTPAAARLYLARGAAAFDDHRYEAAIEEFRRAARVNRTTLGGAAQKRMGDCFSRLGRHREAIIEYLKVGYLYEATPEIAAEALYRAGESSEAREDWREARKHYRRVQEAHAGTPWAGRAAERLKYLKDNSPLTEGW